jgi:hypothetical protein
MKDKINKQLMQELGELLAPFPDACEFTIAYKAYIHDIDDLVDEKERPSAEKVIATFAKASAVFSLPFWRQHSPALIVLEQVINNCYADSVEWETAAFSWKRNDANVLRHVGIEMFFAVLLLTVGRAKTREFSSKFREQCHLLQTDEEEIKN